MICISYGFINNIFTPVTLTVNTDRHYFLPKNSDKTNLTDSEKLFIESYKICKGDTSCKDDLMGIAWRETKHKCSAVGDFGSSHGCFQIHQGYHPEITQEQAEDIKFSVNWTYKRLVHYGYPEYRSYAIRKHNGSPTNPTTKSYLQSVNNYVNN